jgi:hypothetical protein
VLILLGHATTPDKLEVITGQAVAVDAHVSYVDASDAVPPVVQDVNRQNTAISTATTTAICTAPTNAARRRNVKTVNIRNKHASSSVDVTVNHNIPGGTTVELIKVTLRAGECLEYVEGVGWFVIASVIALPTNKSVAQQGAGFATDTYLTGSDLKFPTGYPQIGTAYILTFDVSKTAAGTATPIITVRLGTAGTTADTARCTFTFSAGTGATDVAAVTVTCVFRAVGSGTSAVLQGRAQSDSQPTTGFSSLIKAVQNTSGGFDSTVAGLIIGASYNGGTSAAHTVQLVTAELKQL